MPIVRGLLDRVILVSAAVAGGLVPGFIAQYRQRLGGRLDQARLDLEPWQKLADQFYQGDIDKLIQYHLASTGAAIGFAAGITRWAWTIALGISLIVIFGGCTSS